MHVLVVHRQSGDWKTVNFNLGAALGAEVYWAADSASAVDYLLQDNAIDLLICENSSDSLVVLKYLMSVDAPVPYIVIGEEEGIEVFPDLKILGNVNLISQVDELAKIVKDAVSRGDLPVGDETGGYCRIATELLLKVVPLKSDIYVRLSKIKFIKMFRSGQTFKSEDARRYLEKKKIQYLYVKNDDAQKIVVHLNESLTRLVESDEVPEENRGKIAAAILDSAADLAGHLGFTEEVRQIARRGVDMALKSVGKSPKLSRMVDFVKAQRGTYFSSHAIAISYVACAIAAKLDWPSESTYAKLTMAAFFHDIVLRKPKLAEIETVADIEANDGLLSGEDLDYVKTHPMAGAEVLRKFKEMPPDVDVIVAQHHERPDGSGFPRKLTSNHIAPLAALFIVAHDVVQFIYEEPEDASFEAFVKRFGYSQDYTRGTFAKAIEAVDFPVK